MLTTPPTWRSAPAAVLRKTNVMAFPLWENEIHDLGIAALCCRGRDRKGHCEFHSPLPIAQFLTSSSVKLAKEEKLEDKANATDNAKAFNSSEMISTSEAVLSDESNKARKGTYGS